MKKTNQYLRLILLFLCFILNNALYAASAHAYGDKNIMKMEKDPKTGVETVYFREPISIKGHLVNKARLLSLDEDENGNLNAFPGFENECDSVSFFNKRLKKEEKKRDSFSLSFPDPLTDGGLYLSVYPNIIILSTSHNNPNPSYVEWYQFITKPQFDALKELMAERAKDLSVIISNDYDTGEISYSLNPFYKQMPYWVGDKLSEKEQRFVSHVVSQDRKNYKYMSVAYLIGLANTKIADKKQKINVPDFKKMYNFKSVKISYGTQEMEDAYRIIDPLFVTEKGLNQYYDFPENVTITVSNGSGKPVYLQVKLESIYKDKAMSVELKPGEDMIKPGSERVYAFNFHEMLGNGYQKGYYDFVTAFSERKGVYDKKISRWGNYFKVGKADSIKEIFQLTNKYDFLSQLYSFLKSKQLQKPENKLNEAETTLIDLYDLEWILSGDMYDISGACNYLAPRGTAMTDSLKRAGSKCHRKYIVELMSYFPGKKIMPDSLKIAQYIKELDNKQPGFYEKMNFRDYSEKNCKEDLQDLMFNYVMNHKDEFADEKN